ncbi:MAG: hypothetical protein WCP62_14410, partial [Planctomycetota bacterium]
MSNATDSQSTSAKWIVIAANPKSGASSGLTKAQRLKEAFVADGWQVEMTTDLDQMQQMVHRLHQSGELRTVVSAGGD